MLAKRKYTNTEHSTKQDYDRNVIQ